MSTDTQGPSAPSEGNKPWVLDLGEWQRINQLIPFAGEKNLKSPASILLLQRRDSQMGL